MKLLKAYRLRELLLYDRFLYFTKQMFCDNMGPAWWNRSSEDSSPMRPLRMHTKGGICMTVMEVLTLLLVIFAILEYIENRRK